MTTLEAQHEVITNLILENKKLMQERDEAKVAIRALAEHGESEIQRITKERDEARNKMADALREVDLRILCVDRMNQECYELRKELEEYRSIAENIGAVKAVSEKEKAIRERDEALEELNDIRINLGEDAEGHTLLHAVCALQNERDDLYYKLQDTKQSLEVALEDLSSTRKELQQWLESTKTQEVK